MLSKLILFFFASILNLSSCQSFPPSTGNFFYTELLTDDDAERYVEIMAGIEVKEKHKLYVTTSQGELGLFSDQCSQCNVEDKWQPSLSGTAKWTNA